MSIRVGINGYGRIGRNVLRALYESGRTGEIQIVAINDLGDTQTNAHLTRYDTAHGKFPGKVEVDGEYMVVNGDKIRVLAERDPAKLPWGELKVDVVFECTGLFTTREKASLHLKGGAIGDERAVRQTDAEGRANFGALDGKGIVVLTVHVAGNHQVVLKDFESFPSDHINRKD